MALLRGSSFTGLPTTEGRVTGPILASQHRTLAEDAAYLWERITGANADGGVGAPVVTPHVHEEAHSLIPLPLLAAKFGNPAGIGKAASHYTQMTPASVLEATGVDITGGALEDTPNTDDFVLWYVPIYVPPSLVGFTIRVMLTCSEVDSRCLVSLGTGIGTWVTGQDFAPFSVANTPPDAVGAIGTGRNIVTAGVTPATSGVHVLRISTSAYAREYGSLIRRYFYDLHAIPAVAWGNPTLPVAPIVVTGTNVNVGNPEDSHKWSPIDGTLVNNQREIGTATMLNAHNVALIQEKALGLPASGNDSLTTTPHDHSGLTARGAEISYPVGAWAFGAFADSAWWPTSSGAVSIYDFYRGNGADAPMVGSNSFTEVCRLYIRTPASATASSGTLRFAAVGYQSNGKGGGKLECKVTTNPGTGSANSVTLSSASTAADYVILTNASGVNFNSDGYTPVLVEIRDTVNTGLPLAGLTGLCAYFDR